MNARVQWLDETPGTLGRVEWLGDGMLGFGWKDPPPASDPALKSFQAALNVILSKLGYYGIAVDGRLGPGTCGAFAMLGDLKNAGQVSDADWSSLDYSVISQITGLCQGWTMPTKKGQTKPDKPTTTLTKEELALPWGAGDSRTPGVQVDVNQALMSHDYEPIPVTGVLDSQTCGAFKLATDSWGNDYMNAYGLNCKSFTTPKKKGGGGGGSPPTPECSSTKPCPAGQICEAGKCVPGGEVPGGGGGGSGGGGGGGGTSIWGIVLLAGAAVGAIYLAMSGVGSKAAARDNPYGDGYMHYKITVKGRTFATNDENDGVFELIRGAYQQHRGTSQTPKFQSEAQFRRYVQEMLRGARAAA